MGYDAAVQPPYPPPPPHGPHPSYPPGPYGAPPPYGFGAPPPPPPPAARPAWGVGLGVAALGMGVVTFLYVGMLGGRAAAEIVFGLLGLTVVSALFGVIYGVQDLRAKATGRGAAAIAMSALGVLVVGTGLLFEKLHQDEIRKDYARAERDFDDDRRSGSRASAEPKERARGEGEPVRVEVYTMSQCPYCVPADAALHEVQKELGPDVKIELFYVGKIDEASGALSSMHGADEVTGDLAQVCAAKLSPKLLDFVVCQNQDNKAVAQNWRACAASTGIPEDKLAACMTGDEGKALLAASFRATQAKGVRAAPTIYVAGTQHQGPRNKGAFLRSICAAYQGKPPSACERLADAPKVEVTLLGDARCADCDPKKATTWLSSRVSNPVIRHVDYGSPEGKALYAEIAPMELPAAVFDKSLDADEDAKSGLGKSLKVAGDRKVAKIGTWDPRCADDCSRPGCSANAACGKPSAPPAPTSPH